jgi:hypothetical protein
MYQLSQAISDKLEYHKIADGRWRVTFNGALSASAESKNPESASWEVKRQLDRLIAEWIVRRPEPELRDADPAKPRAGSKRNKVVSMPKR